MCEASAASRLRACQSPSLDNVTQRLRCPPSTSTPTCPQSLFCSPCAPFTGLSSGAPPPSPPFLKPSQAHPSSLVSPLRHHAEPPTARQQLSTVPKRWCDHTHRASLASYCAQDRAQTPSGGQQGLAWPAPSCLPTTWLCWPLP